MVLEIAGARLLSNFLGSSLHVWATVIGFVLASLSLGYYIGGKLSGGKALPLALSAAGISTALFPYLAKALVPLTAQMGIEAASLASGSLLFVPGLFYGMVSPNVIRMVKEGRSSSAPGAVFGVSTFGSLAGSLGTGFLLIPSMRLTEIFLAAGALMLASAFFSYRGDGK